MMLIATILNGMVIDVREYDEMPVFAPSFTNIDITNYNEEVAYGYLYDEESGTFVEAEFPAIEPEIEPPLENPPSPPIDESLLMQSQILLNTELLILMNELSM